MIRPPVSATLPNEITLFWPVILLEFRSKDGLGQGRRQVNVSYVDVVANAE